MAENKQTQRGWEMVEDLIKIHEAIIAEVDFEQQNNKLAIYILLGGMITSLIRLLYAIDHGDLEKIAQLQRVISESMDLVIFFSEPGEKTRQIKQWFNGKIIERTHGNKGNLSIEDRAKSFKTQEKAILNMDASVKTANDILSVYVHPSIDLMTMTFDKSKKRFNYYAKREDKFSGKQIKSMMRLAIHSVLTALGISLYHIFLLNEVKYLKTVALFTRELYPESFKGNK